MTWKDRLRRAVTAVQPYTDVAEQVAHLAVRIQHMTPVAAVGLVATGANAIRRALDDTHHRQWDMPMLVSRGHLVEALEAVGAKVRVEVARGPGGGAERTVVTFGGEQFFIARNGSLLHANPTPEFESWVRQALDRVLPACMRVGAGAAGVVSAPLELTRLRSEQGAAIAVATTPLLAGGPRCILLDGRPGVGKTTMAQEIAQVLDLGRVVVIEGSMLGSTRGAGEAVVATSSAPAPAAPDRPRPESFAMLGAGCIIVDDVDKIWLGLEQVEAMRAACKLLILTANNGDHDEVLDAALIRCGRVDERFEVKAGHADRAPPFDRLDDETWNEVRDWPVAYQNEVAARVRHRGVGPDALRLDDLRERIGRRTRSGRGVYP